MMNFYRGTRHRPFTALSSHHTYIFDDPLSGANDFAVLKLVLGEVYLRDDKV